MNEKILEIKADLLERGLSENMIKRAERNMGTPAIKGFPEVLLDLSSPLSVDGWRLMTMNRSYIGLPHKYKSASELNATPSWENSQHYVYEYGECEFRLPKSDDGSCEFIEHLPDGSQNVKEFSGENKIFEMGQYAKERGKRNWKLFCERMVSTYEIAPILAGLESAGFHDGCPSSVRVRDAQDGALKAMPVADFLHILSESDILSEIGVRRTSETKEVPFESLWENTKLFSPSNEIDLAYSRRDDELLPALCELNPKYAPGVEGDKIFILDKSTGYKCPYDAFKENWTKNLGLDFAGRKVHITPAPLPDIGIGI